MVPYGMCNINLFEIRKLIAMFETPCIGVGLKIWLEQLNEFEVPKNNASWTYLMHSLRRSDKKILRQLKFFKGALLLYYFKLSKHIGETEIKIINQALIA